MQIEHSNEIDLIRQTLAGDTSAFDRLVKTHRSTVYVVVISYIKNPADAEDLTQRIFIRAYERLATLRQLDRFLPWIQQIAHNICKDWLRQRNDSTTSFDAMNHADFADAAPSPEDIALKREVEAVVREAIGALQETDRKLVEGRYIEGASYDELQVESCLSYAAIANRLKRAKQQMRRRIEKLLGGMAILPGRTFIWGGIETVKLSMKAKLAMVGVVAVLGIGGGVWYHHTFESNPVIVNEQRVSEPEAVTEDRLTEIQKTSTAESITPEAWEQLDAFIASLKALDETVEGQARPSEAEAGTVSSTEEVSEKSDEAWEQQRLARLEELQQAWDEGWQKVEANIAQSNELADEYERLLQRYVELIDDQNQFENDEEAYFAIQKEIDMVHEELKPARQMRRDLELLLQEEREEIGKQLKAIKDEIRLLGGELRK